MADRNSYAVVYGAVFSTRLSLVPLSFPLADALSFFLFVFCLFAVLFAPGVESLQLGQADEGDS